MRAAKESPIPAPATLAAPVWTAGGGDEVFAGGGAT